jgi:hypothetical protein
VNGGASWIVGALLAAPAVVFFALHLVLGGRMLVAGVATAVLGSAAAAFLAVVGSAMATAVDPDEAMLRDAAIGLAGSGGVAAVVGAVITLLRRVVAGGPPT